MVKNLLLEICKNPLKRRNWALGRNRILLPADWNQSSVAHLKQSPQVSTLSNTHHHSIFIKCFGRNILLSDDPQISFDPIRYSHSLKMDGGFSLWTVVWFILCFTVILFILLYCVILWCGLYNPTLLLILHLLIKTWTRKLCQQMIKRLHCSIHFFQNLYRGEKNCSFSHD